MVRDRFELAEFYRPLLILAALLGLCLLGLPRIEHAWAWRPATATVAAAPTQCAYVSSLLLANRPLRSRDFVGSCGADVGRGSRREVPLYPLSYEAGGQPRQALLSSDHLASDAYAPGDRVAILVDPADPAHIDGPISLWADWHWLLAMPAAAIQLAVVLAMASGIAPWRSLAALRAGAR